MRRLRLDSAAARWVGTGGDLLREVADRERSGVRRNGRVNKDGRHRPRRHHIQGCGAEAGGQRERPRRSGSEWPTHFHSPGRHRRPADMTPPDPPRKRAASGASGIDGKLVITQTASAPTPEPPLEPPPPRRRSISGAEAAQRRWLRATGAGYPSNGAALREGGDAQGKPSRRARARGRSRWRQSSLRRQPTSLTKSSTETRRTAGCCAKCAVNRGVHGHRNRRASGTGEPHVAPLLADGRVAELGERGDARAARDDRKRRQAQAATSMSIT